MGQDELLLAMKAEGKQPTITESIRLFDNQDLCMLLQISKRTLQRYRSVGALPYKTLGKKTYYSEEDVLTFLSNHIKDFKKEDIAFYKARIHNNRANIRNHTGNRAIDHRIFLLLCFCHSACLLSK